MMLNRPWNIFSNVDTCTAVENMKSGDVNKNRQKKDGKNIFYVCCVYFLLPSFFASLFLPLN